MDQDILLSLFDSFPDALVAADTNRKIFKVNAAFTELFGYKEDECLGKETSMLYNNLDDFYKTGKQHFNVDAQENKDTCTIEYKKKDGQSFFGETTSAKVKDDAKNISGFVGIIRDISYRRKFDDGVLAFQKITASDNLEPPEKIAAVLKLVCEYYNADLGIISHIQGHQYEVEYCYDRDENLETGTTFNLQNTYCEKTFNTADIVHTANARNSEYAKLPCYQEFNLNTYIGQRIVVDGKPYGTLSFSAKESRKKDFSVRDYDIFNVTANWISYALTREKYQSELIEQRERAEEQNSAKTSFIANISHEVRTPLNGIMGYADILANMIDDPDIQALSKKIQTSAYDLLDILNDLIDISKLESGEFKVQRATFSPKNMFKEITELFMPRAIENRNIIKARITPNIPNTMIGDAKRIKQVLSNLVNNAVKFTEDGEIKVSALHDKTKGHIRFQVADTGIGIPDDMQEKIFQEYVQADSGVAKKYGGTGLGLSITKNLVEMMNGKISLTSKIGMGTIVTVSIPAQPAEDEIIDQEIIRQSRENDESYKTNARKPKILLVEDIPMNAEIAQAMLYRAECETEHAANGREALDYIRGNKYDLILLDIQMPDIDGITVAREARKMGIQTPIVALTAHVMEHEIQEFIDAGMDDYLAKPVIYDKLHHIIEIWAR